MGAKVSKPAFTHFKRNTRKQSVLSTDELYQFMQPENFTLEMFYVFFLVCLSAGLRLGEVRALRPCQLIQEKHALIIDGFLKREGERTNFNKTGNADNPRYRVVLIPNLVLKLLSDWIDKNEVGYNEFVFQYENRPIRKEFAEKEFRRALKKAGIDTDDRKITPHALRYTYVTRTRRLLDTSTTMMMTGHSSEQMSDYYTRFELEETIKQLVPIQDQVEKFFD